jgi:glycosyltransferase involved in cell wall biosynthesis
MDNPTALRRRAGAIAELEALMFTDCAAAEAPPGRRPVPGAWSLEFPDLGALAGPRAGAGAKRLSVCIATEDIIGPVRNGGIGTTYASLADMLAEDGHDVTVLYLLQHSIEHGTLSDWERDYAARGIKFVPAPDYFAIDGVSAPEQQWLRAPYKMMRYLLEHRFDVVHVSEWRGTGFFSLLAKHQGLALQDTLFVVKASSPWLWNRLYAGLTVDNTDDLNKIHAERRSIELADIVVSGSRHLLRWMASRGYRLPADRTFVQPNLLRLKLPASAQSRRARSRVPIDEIAFFGRLEGRKGLLTFCHAIRRLIQQGRPLPPRVSFVGKPGIPLDSSQSNLQFLKSITRDWPATVETHTGFTQPQALEYLLGGRRLAVMPSLIENSSLAVYEALLCRIPFVASNVGGNPELIDPADHARVLCDPHPIALADKLAEAIESGGYIAATSFDNDANIWTWRQFHRNLADGVARELASRRGTDESPSAAARTAPASTAVCIYYTGNTQALAQTLASIERQEQQPQQVLVAVDVPGKDAAAPVKALFASSRQSHLVLQTSDCDAGLAFNLLAEASHSRFLLFLWEGTTLRPSALRLLSRSAVESGAGVVNGLYRLIEQPDASRPPPLRFNIPGSAEDAICREAADAQPLYVARETFFSLGGFTTDYRTLGYDQELVAQAQAAGVACETVPFELAAVPAFRREWLRERGYDEAAGQFRAIRPCLASAPLALQDVILFANGVSRAQARERDPLHHLSALWRWSVDWIVRAVSSGRRRTRRLLRSRGSPQVAPRTQQGGDQFTGALGEKSSASTPCKRA